MHLDINERPTVVSIGGQQNLGAYRQKQISTAADTSRVRSSAHPQPRRKHFLFERLTSTGKTLRLTKTGVTLLLQVDAQKAVYQ